MIFMLNRKELEKMIRLEYRIKELEDKLCPYEKHDWVLVRNISSITSIGEVHNEYLMKCGRCGRETVSSIPVFKFDAFKEGNQCLILSND